MPSTTTDAAATPQRAAAYREVLARYGVDMTTNNTGASDARHWLDGRPLHRFAVITEGEEGYRYAKPEADALDAATAAAVAFATDYVYAETPIAVVDLDTGATYVPDWDRLPWRETGASKRARRRATEWLRAHCIPMGK